MMADVARLALQIDVNGAQRARQALQGLQDGSIRATRATDQLVAANTRLNATAARSAGVFRLQKGAIQQAGFQIGDFATQVAGGQSALVAFAQQGSQLAGILGPGGAVLGAVIAIGGAIAGGLVRAFSDGSEEAKTLAERILDVADSTDELTAAQIRALKLDFFAGNRDRLQKITAERQRIKELNEEIAENERLMQQQAGQRDTGMTSGILGTTVQGLRDQAASTSQLAERNRDLRKELDKTQGSIDTYFQEADKLNKKIQELIFGEDDHAKTIERAKEEVNDLNASLQFQIDTYGESERAIQLAKIQQLSKNGADAEAIRQARALTNALYDKIEAEEAAAEAERQAEAKAKAMAKANSEFERSWIALQDKIDPVGADLRQFGQDVELIQEAFNRGLITQEQADLAVNRLNQVGEATKQTSAGFQLFTAQQQSALGTFGQIFGNMAEIAEKGGKDQFDTWKAMASAQAAVNTALAISNALATPPAPVGIALAGTIGALGAVQIAQIQQTEYQGSFLGGGYTGTGSRTGGVDGRGGFPAILHPNETVIDHELAGSKTTNSSQVNQTVVMQISGDVTERTRTEIMKAMPMIREQAKAAVIQAAGRGGSMSKAVGRRR